MIILNKKDLRELQKRSPNEILDILKKLEAQIKSKSPKSKEEDYVGVPVVDWLVSQVLFVRKAWRFLKVQVSSIEEALWLLEMLSLPECLRRTSRIWKKERLIEEALVKGNLRWRDVLRCRRKSDSVESYPRTPNFNFYPRQLTPYISSIPCSRKWPNPWGYPRVIEFSLQILSSTQKGGALVPIQRGASFSFFIEIFTNRSSLIFDLPRKYESGECIDQLNQWKDLLDRHISSLKKDSSQISSHEEQSKIVGLIGWGSPLFYNIRDTQSLYKACQKLRMQLEKDIARLQGGKIRPSQRSTILQKHFHVPHMTWFVPLRTIPSDLSPDFLAMVLGAWLSKHDMLSRKEKEGIKRFFERKILFRAPDLTTDKARMISEEAFNRLGQFNRPLQGKSIGAYFGLTFRRRHSQNPKETRWEDMDQFEETSNQTPLGTILKRIPKGERLRLAKRLGCPQGRFPAIFALTAKRRVLVIA